MRSVGMLRYEAMLARTDSRSIAVIDSDDVGNVIQIVEYVMIASAAGMGVDVDMGVGVGAAEHSETCTSRTHNGRRGSGEGVGVGTGASAALAALQAHLAVACVGVRALRAPDIHTISLVRSLGPHRARPTRCTRLRASQLVRWSTCACLGVRVRVRASAGLCGMRRSDTATLRRTSMYEAGAGARRRSPRESTRRAVSSRRGRTSCRMGPTRSLARGTALHTSPPGMAATHAR